MIRPNLGTLIRNFFEQYLVSQRGLSGHTVLAYRDNRKQRGKAPDGCQAPLERGAQRAELN